jgi:hypothetical protein
VFAMIDDTAGAPLLDRASDTIAQIRERGGQIAYVRVGFGDGVRRHPRRTYTAS